MNMIKPLGQIKSAKITTNEGSVAGFEDFETMDAVLKKIDEIIDTLNNQNVLTDEKGNKWTWSYGAGLSKAK